MSVTLNNHTADLMSELYVDLNDNLYVSRIPIIYMEFLINLSNWVNILKISCVIGKRASKLEYHALIKTGQLNLCDFFERPDREPVLKLLLHTLEKYGHMMFQCPVEKVNVTKICNLKRPS